MSPPPSEDGAAGGGAQVVLGDARLRRPRPSPPWRARTAARLADAIELFGALDDDELMDEARVNTSSASGSPARRSLYWLTGR